MIVVGQENEKKYPNTIVIKLYTSFSISNRTAEDLLITARDLRLPTVAISS